MFTSGAGSVFLVVENQLVSQYSTERTTKKAHYFYVSLRLKKKGLQFIRTGDLYLAAVKSDIVISDK